MKIPQLGVSYFGNRFLSHAKTDLDRLAGCCDYVVHTVSESDLSYHKSIMSKIFNETRKRGLEVWADPWGLGGVFGGEAYSKFLLDHRKAWQVMSDGRFVPGACMNRPEFRSYVMEWVLSVRDMGAQVIFWDEPHMVFDLDSEWDGIYSCTCEICQQAFKKKYGAAQPPRLNEHAREFRRDTIKNFLGQLMAFSKSKGLKNALCLYAFKGNAEYDLIWKEAASAPDLDIFGCDPYWRWRSRQDPEAHVKDFSKRVIDATKPFNKQTQIWIQAMRLPAQAESEILRACQAARDEGISHLAAWSYDGGELLDTVLSERPQEVWDTVQKAYNIIRAQRG